MDKKKLASYRRDAWKFYEDTGSLWDYIEALEEMNSELEETINTLEAQKEQALRLAAIAH